MTVDAQHFRTKSIIVGFRAVPLMTADKQPFYSSVRIKASPDNTAIVFVGPGSNVTTFADNQGFPLGPGEHID
jgi:hypothetical protein